MFFSGKYGCASAQTTQWYGGDMDDNGVKCGMNMAVGTKSNVDHELMNGPTKVSTLDLFSVQELLI